MTIPPATRKAGDLGHTTDHNDIAATLTTLLPKADASATYAAKCSTWRRTPPTRAGERRHAAAGVVYAAKVDFTCCSDLRAGELERSSRTSAGPDSVTGARATDRRRTSATCDRLRSRWRPRDQPRRRDTLRDPVRSTAVGHLHFWTGVE